MKQGILITAYKNVEQLISIADFFNDDFSLFIHVDLKSSIPDNDLHILSLHQNVKLVRKKYKTNWGGLLHLKAILYLATEALKDDSLDFFHLISGSDFPIQSCHHFKKYVEKNVDKNFLHYDKWIPKLEKYGFANRIELFNFYDIFNGKGRAKYLIKIIQDIQKMLKIKRSFKNTLPPLFGGSTWWSLNRACLTYVIEYTTSFPELLQRLKYTFCSEEIYFQTVIMNSPFSKFVVNDALRYIDWRKRNGNSPAVLDDSDLKMLLSSDKLFARKFESPTSSSLRLNLFKFLS